jgi:predicted ArsR family transcriptional regulator
LIGGAAKIEPMSMLELIAEPVRLRIARRLASAGPATLQELADAANVHLNTARVHVSAMEDAGAVISRPRLRPGRGKQGLEYELAEGWALGSSDFRAIAEILATAVQQQRMSPARRMQLGRAWGRYILGRPGVHDPADEVLRALDWLGYVAQIEDDHLQLVGCPCILVSPAEPWPRGWSTAFSRLPEASYASVSGATSMLTAAARSLYARPPAPVVMASAPSRSLIGLACAIG